MTIEVTERSAKNLGDVEALSARTVALRALCFTRLPVLIVGALAVAVVGTSPPPVAEALWRVSANEYANLLARWDSAFYYSIATTGYSWDPSSFTHQNVVFFPLYPMLMRGAGALIGGHPLLAGLFVSLAAFTVAIALVYQLALIEIGSDYAWRAVLLLTAFPYALFFSAAYTESLFLLLSVAAFYAMRRGRFATVALVGVAIGLTRPNGSWIALPLAALAVGKGASGMQPSRRVLALTAACAPLAGLALFSAYLHFRFDDALAWLHGQRAWGVAIAGLRGAPDPARLPWEPALTTEEVITWIGNIAAFCAAAVACVPVARRLGAAYGIWIAINIVPPVPAHLFLSLGRFTAVLFPFFFWLAWRIPRRRLAQVAVLFAAGQAVLAAWFFLWKPVV